MRNKLLLISTFTVLLNSIVLAQAPYWKLNGNPSTLGDAVNATNNFLGTNATNNIPIKIGTQGQQRLYIAETNALPGSFGNVGIGRTFFQGGPFVPLSNLHIAQDNSLNPFGGGIRTWMQTNNTNGAGFNTNSAGTGMLITNGDNVWLGLKNKGAYDLNDAILNWGDNGGVSTSTDYFRFNFTHFGTGFLGSANDGLEIMRLSPNSFVGVGDFNISNIVQPTSKLHIHENTSLHPGGTPQSVWMQMTNTDFAQNPTTNNGLRIGLLYQNAAQRTGNAFIYNQENRHLIFSTNHATPDGPGSINNTQERMRITSISAPTTLPTGYGVYNPGAAGNTDLTRIAISHNPNTPVTRPLSLLHLGYNAPDANGTATDMSGWRPWMDVGTFTNYPAGILGSGTGISMYTGLKLNPFSPTNGFSSDAVVSWGYTPTTSPTQLKTRMRFLFTTNTTGTTTAAGANGIEAGHFWSDGDNTRMGVGDFMNGTTDLDPDNTLEIKSSTLSPYWASGNASGLRFTNLISTDSVVIPNTTNGINKSKWLTVDKNGDVVLSSLIQIGNACGTTPINPLANNWEVRMQNKNYIFNDNELGSVGIGAFANNCAPANTLEIVANANSPYPLTSSSGLRLTRLTSASSIVPNGTSGVNSNKLLTVDANGDVVLTSLNAPTGVLGNYCANTDNPLTGNYEIPLNNNRFVFSGFGTVNIGPNVSCASPNIAQLYVRNSLNTNLYSTIRASYDGSLSGPGGTAIYGEAISPNDYAGFFDGNVWVNDILSGPTGQYVASDKRIKDEITNLGSSLGIISKLSPVSYKLNNTYATHIVADGRRNYGFIAQEIEQIIPELVKEITILQTTDSLGNVLDSAVTLKSLNYTGLIPFAIGGIQELDKKQREIIAILDKAGLSDVQVKNNVSSFNALSKIKQLSPVSYNFTNANVPQLSFGNETDYGFVAQQLETVYPELIDTVRIAETLDSLGNIQNPSVVLKTVNYKAMSALLTRAVQEQQLTIDSLKQAQNSQDSINNSVQNQLAQLTTLMNSCCQNTSSRTNTAANNTVIDVELSDKDIIVLNQNVPNPFAEQTTIAYSIPEKSGFAQIIFNDMKGQIIKVIDIKTRGKGQLNVFANDLSTGMYTYSLYVDGKLIDTKKMVKTE